MCRGRFASGGRRVMGVPQIAHGKRALMRVRPGMASAAASSRAHLARQRRPPAHGRSTDTTAGNGTRAAGAEGCSSSFAHAPNEA